MYDPRTLPKDRIPKSMIAADDEFKDQLSSLSAADETGYYQAKDLIHSLSGEPAVIDMAGGYGGALKKSERMRTRKLFSDIKHFIHDVYPALSSAYVPYHDYIRRQYREGTLMSQDDIVDDIFNMVPEPFFDTMINKHLKPLGHQDPEKFFSDHDEYNDYIKFVEKELRKFYTPERIQQIAKGKL